MVWGCQTRTLADRPPGGGGALGGLAVANGIVNADASTLVLTRASERSRGRAREAGVGGARPPTVAFIGWFGCGDWRSIVFAVILVEGADLANESVLLDTIFLTIGLSVLLHGLTGAPARSAIRRVVRGRSARRNARLRECSGSDPSALKSWTAGLLGRHQDVDDVTPPAP